VPYRPPHAARLRRRLQPCNMERFCATHRRRQKESIDLHDLPYSLYVFSRYHFLSLDIISFVSGSKATRRRQSRTRYYLRSTQKFSSRSCNLAHSLFTKAFESFIISFSFASLSTVALNAISNSGYELVLGSTFTPSTINSSTLHTKIIARP